MFRLTTALFNSFSSAPTPQKFFFLFGAPGVGKGTYAKLLKKDLVIAKHELANANLKNELLELKLLTKK